MDKTKGKKRNIYGWVWVTAYLLVILAALVNKAIIWIYYPQLAYAIGILLLATIILLTRNLFNTRENRRKINIKKGDDADN